MQAWCTARAQIITASLTSLLMASITLEQGMLAGPADSHSQLKCKPDANMTRLASTAALGRWQSLASVSSWVRLASVCRAGLTPAVPAPWSTPCQLASLASYGVEVSISRASCAPASYVERGISETGSLLHSGDYYLESLCSVGPTLDWCDMTSLSWFQVV